MVQSSFNLTITQAAQFLADEQWDVFAAVLWGIWRCRNDVVYAGGKPSLRLFSIYMQTVHRENMLAKCKVGIGGDGPQHYQHCSTPGDSYTCMTDGSWSNDWSGGTGYVLFKGEELVAYRSVGITACSSMQAEAKAIQDAIVFLEGRRIHACCFFTDNLVLRDIIQQPNPPIQADWRVCREAFDLWEVFRRRREFKCLHVPRLQNTLADYLAKQGRINRWDFRGFTYPILADWNRELA